MSEIPSQNKVDVGLKFATTDWDKQVDTALLKQLVDERSKRGEGNPLTIITIEEETSLLRRLQGHLFDLWKLCENRYIFMLQ